MDFPVRLVMDSKETVHIWTLLKPPDNPTASLPPTYVFGKYPSGEHPYSVDTGVLLRTSFPRCLVIYSLADGHCMTRSDLETGNLHTVERFGAHRVFAVDDKSIQCVRYQ
jgi:hypothetical protein